MLECLPVGRLAVDLGGIALSEIVKARIFKTFGQSDPEVRSIAERVTVVGQALRRAIGSTHQVDSAGLLTQDGG